MTDNPQPNQDLNKPIQPPQPSQSADQSFQTQQPIQNPYQPVPQQPIYGQYQQPQVQPAQPVNSNQSADKAGNIAFVCGLCSFTGLLVALSGWILGILAIVYASRGMHGANAAKAKAGLVCGIIGLVISALNSFAAIVLFN